MALPVKTNLIDAKPEVFKVRIVDPKKKS